MERSALFLYLCTVFFCSVINYCIGSLCACKINVREFDGIESVIKFCQFTGLAVKFAMWKHNGFSCRTSNTARTVIKHRRPRSLRWISIFTRPAHWHLIDACLQNKPVSTFDVQHYTNDVRPILGHRMISFYRLTRNDWSISNLSPLL